MGAHKFVSVILRFGELVSAAIVAGILGHYLALVSQADDHANSRIVYAVVLAGISLVAALALGFPSRYSFYCFPLDFALAICWFVAFGLLCNLNSRGCTTSWYWNSWGFYWGRWWTRPPTSVTQAAVGTSACAEWRVALAFSFIGAMCWLLSGFLGIYVFTQYPDGDRSSDSERGTSSLPKSSRWRLSSHSGAEPKVSADHPQATTNNVVN